MELPDAVPASPRPFLRACLSAPSFTLHAVAIFLLSCALSMLLGTGPAHAQGPVTGATVSTSVPTVTVPVNTPATFTATVTGATPNPDQYWTVISGPTYSWWGYGAYDPSTTTLSYTFSSAGTNTSTPSCVVSYVVQYARGGTATISETASAAKPVTIYVIGGPTSGENDIYYFCDSSTSTDWGHLHAASGQPAGTIYSWSLTGTGAQLTSSTTAADVTYPGSGAGSTQQGDVKATVTYSLNGVIATSDPYPITVHAPATFTIDPKGKVSPVQVIPPAPDCYGFTGQSIRFQVLDSVDLPFPANKAYWSESWKQPKTGGGQPNHVGGGPLDAQGYSVDRFSLTQLPQPSDPNGDKIWGPLTHIYGITDTGGTGRLVGCPVQVYADVYYNTYGVTGNGFAPKGP